MDRHRSRRLESGYFFEALFELSTRSELKSYGSTNYGEEDVYKGLKDLLNPSATSAAGTDPRLMMPAQRSGVCAWRSLMALMRSKMPLADYLRFKCDIKLQSLHDYMQVLQGEMDAGEVEELPLKWRLVKKSHQKLCRNIVHLAQRKLIGDAYLQQAQELLKPVSDWIHQNADCRFQRWAPPIPADYSAASTAIELKDNLSTSLQQRVENPGQEELALQPYHQVSERFAQIDMTSPESMQEVFTEAIGIGEEGWSQAEDRSLHQSMINLVTALISTISSG